ncbi:SRPBCC domain-containing protein [Cytophagales bacterium LB-30]|uniref:SRPBCC domain-containing protein n=1 Tax=Shiella aurantiaca TaxID=3058365 RepID=A0ABT8F8A1_9BACT|nr:SRPBCC domain-containing protein [Shiella aurantiaca]MDN4166705.1 SRPBCC domain-containing protein [Shiella aurantiaca]
MTKRIFTSSILLLGLSASMLAQSNSTQSIKTKNYDPSTNLVVWPQEFNPEKAKCYVYNKIAIQAKPEVVWDILIDAKNWQTFYKGVESPVELLDTTANTLQSGLAFKMHTMGLQLVPVIKEFVPNERLAWEVRRGNLRAYHAWVIVPTEYGCRLITPESQNGFLTFLQKVFQPNKLLNLHEHWLEAIKERAENNQN